MAGLGTPGRKDGPFASAQFDDPQGMALNGDLLYVADRKNHCIRELDLKYGQGASALMARWREVVGPEIAHRTEPVKLSKPRGGGPSALEIRVAGPSAAIIQHQAHEILARVNLFLGAEAVQKLRIVQGPLRRSETAAPPRRHTQPLDAAQEAALNEGLAAAPDGPLKAALLRLGRAVERRR